MRRAISLMSLVRCVDRLFAPSLIGLLTFAWALALYTVTSDYSL